jgi:hypothetical protein
MQATSAAQTKAAHRDAAVRRWLRHQHSRASLSAARHPGPWLGPRGAPHTPRQRERHAARAAPPCVSEAQRALDAEACQRAGQPLKISSASQLGPLLNACREKESRRCSSQRVMTATLRWSSSIQEPAQTRLSAKGAQLASRSLLQTSTACSSRLTSLRPRMPERSQDRAEPVPSALLPGSLSG